MELAAHLTSLPVTTPITRIEDAEVLIRSIRADLPYSTEDGILRLPSTAFNDRNCKPSVDRVCMKVSPDDCKLKATDGLVCLIAGEVRALKWAQMDKSGKATGTNCEVDILHRPVDPNNPDGLPENPAHSQIESTLTLSRTQFDKLKEKLARFAGKHGWLVQPS